MKALEGRVAPASAQELSEILACCDSAGEKVTIVGGDTLSGMGLPPQRADVTLLTTALNGVVRNERADCTMSALAGTPLQSIATLLATQSQFVPIDAPQARSATLGGTLAAGWLGPRRHLYGRPRDYVIGSTVVLADGTVARAGGMVVKNVAGYDMSRLYVGSFGTLGVLAQANLKTMPLPPQARMFFAPLPEHTRARACVQIAALAIAPAAALWIDGFRAAIGGDDGAEGRIAVLLEGSAPALERATRDVRSALGRAGVPDTFVVDAGARQSFERIVDAYVASLGERSITYRVLKPVQDPETSAVAVKELARHFGLRFESIADVMNGDLLLRISASDSRRLGAKLENFDDALHDLEPRAQVVACAHPHRTNLQVWGAPPDALEKMRALKARFDPNNTLNPGRFIGGI
ncbi:MAG: FAD-binding oxidoreductase [Candidatus Eremiobacteraeota bacterium]|nr:FAD-binding oxidoreductase [Candidatus Eremiobacteraeota bacterium]MBV9057414.1 FAD-binding oxidoreductase [Candidatus Eremiobacteraeota bacterium]MBV9699493.1 FAD-binding oxidoreductase [Candidatus Eremiobacteraeota bacterium]